MSIGLRLFALTSLVIIIAIGSAVALTFWLARGIGAQTVERSLTSSQIVQQVLAEERTTQLALASELIAADPAFVSYLVQAAQGSGLPGVSAQVDTASVRDLLRERALAYGFDFAIAIDNSGQQLARTDQQVAVARDYSDQPLVTAALNSLTPQGGLWAEGENLYQAAVIPLARGRTISGFLVTALAVDNELAEEISRVSGGELSFVHVNENRLTTATSTLDARTDAQLVALLNGRSDDLRTTFETGVPSQLINANIDNSDYAVRVVPLGDANTRAALLAMVNMDTLLAPLDRLRRYLLIAAVAAVALAMFLVSLVTRSTFKPVQRLARAMDNAVAGDYKQRIDTDGPDAFSVIAKSYNTLVSNLREDHALEEHLIELVRADKPGNRAVRRPTRYSHGESIADRYEIIKVIGQGGMGDVYQAFDQELKEMVTIKLIVDGQAADDSTISQLKEETRIARRITHPNVVRIHDFGLISGQPFLSMEYIKGNTVAEILQHADRMRPNAAMKVARDICRGLSAAHEVGVIHRDLKPANLIVQFDGVTKLMDFGIAAPATLKVGTGNAQTIQGTCAYLSPEQIRGENADERSDIYALGVVLMEIFTGRTPFKGRDDEEVCRKHLTEVPDRGSEFWRQMPEVLDDLIMKCLEKRPKDRFANVHEVREALGKIQL